MEKNWANRFGDTSASIEFGIEAVASARHRVRVDVAGEDLQFDVALRGVDLLAKKHGEGIGFFAGTATGDPDSQRSIQRVIAHKVGNNALGQKIENGRVPKEARDIDQQIPGELITFVGIAKQEVEILGGGFDRRQGHPPLDAPLERPVLVKREVMNRLRAQECDNVRQQILQRLLRARFPRLGDKDAASFARDQRLGDLRGAEHEVHCAGCDGAAGHAVIVGFADVLRDDEAAFILDRFQAEAAVGAGSGKDHAARCALHIREPENSTGSRKGVARRVAPAASKAATLLFRRPRDRRQAE